MNKVCMCIRAGGFWALAGVVAVSLPAAFTPAATGQCNNSDPSPDCGDAQIGIQGNFIQVCDSAAQKSDDTTDADSDNDGWTGLAFPFQTGGANVGKITFTLNTNRTGGDVWIMGNTDAPDICDEDCSATPNGIVDVPDLLAMLAAWGNPQGAGTTCDLDASGLIEVPDLLALLAAWGPCPATTVCGQPDITNVLATVCCGLESLATDVVHTINFGSIATSAFEPTWVVFVTRTGLAGMSDIDGDGTADEFHFNGGTFPGHQVARECQIDVNGDCQAPSTANQAFANLLGTGNSGDWTDLHDLGAAPGLGTRYCVSLSASALNDGTNCVNNEALDGVCCIDDPAPACIIEIGWLCGVNGGIYVTNNSVCFLNPYGACSCGPGEGSCLVERLGDPGCEALSCCEVVCTNDSFCCSTEWDQNCADFAAANPVACLPDLAPPTPITLATGADDTAEPWLSISPDVYTSYMVDFGQYDSGPGGPDPENDGHYNPVGPHSIVFNPVTEEYEPEGPTFSTGFMFFTGGNAHEILTDNVGWQSGFNDTTMVKQVLTAHVASDVFGGDGVMDTLTGGSFRVLTLNNSVDITIAVTQSVQITGGLAVYDLTYTMTNNSVDLGGIPIAATFELMRQYDGDHNFDAGAGATDDQVGTTWNALGGDVFIVMQELNQPQTAYTMSSPDADAYSGGKSGDDPDGAGGTLPHSCGTCLIPWDEFGLPASWRNNVSLVGAVGQTFVDGFSNTSIDPADAATYLNIPVSMAANEAGKVISLRVTYGSDTPAP